MRVRRRHWHRLVLPCRLPWLMMALLLLARVPAAEGLVPPVVAPRSSLSRPSSVASASAQRLPSSDFGFEDDRDRRRRNGRRHQHPNGRDDDDDLGSFGAKRDLEARLERLERTAGSTLGGFYEPHLSSFSLKPAVSNRLSITSTCYAVRAILAGNHGGDVYSDALAGAGDGAPPSPSSSDEASASRPSTSPAPSSSSARQLRPILRALLKSEWREDDLFQVPLLLSTLLLADKDRSVLSGSAENEDPLRRMVESVLEARPRRRLGAGGQRYSDYILFLCAQAYAALRESTAAPVAPSSPPPSLSGGDADATDKNATQPISATGIGGLPLRALPDGAAASLSTALGRCAEVSANELYRQLALRSAGDKTEFDVMRLAYSLLAYLASTRALAGTAGLESSPGEGKGPAEGSRVGPANAKLVRAALAAFFDEQLSGGLWDKGQPIYKSFRKQGRNVGNAFVFSVDTVGSLLEALPCEEFRPYLPHLERTLAWVEDHQTVEVIPDYCDAESGQCYGRPLRGWSSPHLSPDTSPLAWSTAQVLTFVSLFRRRVRELMHRDVLLSFRGTSFSEEGPVNKYWDRLLDSDLGRRGAASPGGDDGADVATLKSVLEERVIKPFSSSVENPSFGAAYSAILFGPPGTAKTTITESLARRMGWDFMVIDTSVFLADGLGNVAARIRYVFERLQVLDRCVILFDEIEEFCLDRETPGIGMESRMLTTAMLTAINDLRRAKRSIFFLATNRLRAFDSAITRPGRFDMQLFVGTPNLQARSVLFRQELAKLSVDQSVADAAAESYQSFLSSVWAETAMFMNYLEGAQFARACADIVRTGSALTEDDMSRILKAQAAVMTVRGAVRDEFVASMDMSRL